MIPFAYTPPVVYLLSIIIPLILTAENKYFVNSCMFFLF